MSSKALTVARLCLSNLTATWAVMVFVFALVTIPSVIQIVQAGPNEYFERSYLLSSGNSLYAAIILVPAVIATRHVTKVMHLNASKEVFVAGAMGVYALLAACVAAANNAFYYSLDQSWSRTFQVVNLAEIFGWTSHGPLVSFVQQFAFLFLFAIGVHCLAAMQRTHVGWAVDLVLVTLFGASLVAEPLTSMRVWVSDLLVVQSNAIVQIMACLAVAAVLYAATLTMLRRREL